MLRTPLDRIMAAISIMLGTGFLLLIVTFAGFFAVFWSDLLGISTHATTHWHAYLHRQNDSFGPFFQPFIAVISLAVAWAIVEVLVLGVRSLRHKEAV